MMKTMSEGTKYDVRRACMLFECSNFAKKAVMSSFVEDALSYILKFLKPDLVSSATDPFSPYFWGFDSRPFKLNFYQFIYFNFFGYD